MAFKTKHAPGTIECKNCGYQGQPSRAWFFSRRLFCPSCGHLIGPEPSEWQPVRRLAELWRRSFPSIESRRSPQRYLLPALVILAVAAVSVAFALFALKRDSGSPVSGTWLIYDGKGVQILVFDENGNLPPELGQPESVGQGTLRGKQLIIRVSGLHNLSGEAYSRTFNGSLVPVTKDILPQGVALTNVEAVYAGTLQRTDVKGYSIPVHAFKLTPEFGETSVAGKLVGTPPPTAPAPPSFPPPVPFGTATPTVQPSVGVALTPVPGEEPSGRIAFQSFSDIYVINPDGSGQVQLTNSPKTNLAPSWSPDGSQIAFVSYRDPENGNDVYIMQANGSDVRRITNFPGFKGAPVWSPDGLRLAFSNGPTGPGPLYMINVDGTGLTQITDFTASIPDWSPDGNWLTFNCYEGSATEVCVMNTDGRELDRLTDPSWNASGPVWSPDGTKIAFVRDNAVYVMNRDGSDARRIAESIVRSPIGYPALCWSPDGKYIAFVSNRDGTPQVYVMNADGSNQHPITQNARGGMAPDWVHRLTSKKRVPDVFI